MSKQEETEKLTYAEAVKELEEIVARMQSDNCCLLYASDAADD